MKKKKPKTIGEVKEIQPIDGWRKWFAEAEVWQKKMEEWKEQKCEDCFYCIESDCRRIPPTFYLTGDNVNFCASAYPNVLLFKACAEFCPKSGTGSTSQ